MNRMSILHQRLKSRFQAFFVLAACIALTSLTACFDTAPPLDMTGDLTYTDLVVGTGATISADSTVITQIGINFYMKLKDSTLVQDAQGQTIYALVGSIGNNNNVGPGLDSMMRGMRVGSVRRIIVPPRFGFGNQASGNIPANSTLIYTIELRKAEEFIREDILVGTGDTVKLNSSVDVKYVGKLLNGNIFDATISDNTFNFRVGQKQVITGWDIGLLGMQAGGKRRLSIPSLLGYGAAGSPPRIPSHATLIFEIEVVNVVN